ncbi:MAG: hypothetical protein H0X24_00840 [Ktedonobacterales bacterium]|nr:hypothetical protein [Ktedonobacterales bacterium]
MSSPDPIGTLTTAAKETVRRADPLLQQLTDALAKHQIAQAQQPNYGWLKNAIWTLKGRLAAYHDGTLAGSLAEQATSINAAMEDLAAAAQSVQHVLTQLP